MKRLSLVVLSIVVVMSFSLEKNNPFLGFWEIQLENEESKAFIMFKDTSVTYFAATSFGNPLIPLGSHKYSYSKHHLFSYLKKRKDTSFYLFPTDSNLLLIDLNYSDTLKLKKAQP